MTTPSHISDDELGQLLVIALGGAMIRSDKPHLTVGEIVDVVLPIATKEATRLAMEVIGEDEFHQDTSFGGALPKFQTTSMAYRNTLRAEQRKRLSELTKGKGR